MRKHLLATLAISAIFVTPALAFDIGVGHGSVQTGAVSGSMLGVQSGTGSGSQSLLLGATSGGARSGQTATATGLAGAQASCTDGPNCVSLAENAGTNGTRGNSRSRTGSLGIAGTIAAGQGAGISNGINAGQATANYGFVSLFARP